MRDTLGSIRYFDNFNYDLRISIITDDCEDFKVYDILEVIPIIEMISFYT
jgi:hypothetical protein